MEQKSIKLNAILNVMKTVFSLIFPLITFPYVTRMLQVEAMGKYDFSGSIISYFTLLAALGINIYAVREGSKYKNDKEKINQFASEIFSINVYSTIASYILLFICLIFIQKLHGYTVIILIFSLQLLLATMSVTWVYNIFEDFGYITMVTLAMQFIALILMFLLVHFSCFNKWIWTFYVFSCKEVCKSSVHKKTTAEASETNFNRFFNKSCINNLCKLGYNNTWLGGR